MTKLWQKKYPLDKDVEQFTVGNDYILDAKLIRYDIQGSLAHAAMLNRIGILKDEEHVKLKKALIQLLESDAAEKSIIIQAEDEDVHTAIENYLTKKLGDIGKKIHTARSRNDQVSVDLRLYIKDEIIEVKKLLIGFIETLISKSKENMLVPMPGYTHMQKAMPSSVALWLMSFSESMIDNMKILEIVYEINNQCPLGSAAGYGTNFPIDRQYVSDLLGFEKVQNNVLYVQNSRGKNEAQIVFAMSNIMSDLSKLSTDILLFSTSEFQYMTLPKEFCTGSSIMPQKKNLDLMELTRAKAVVVNAKYQEIVGIIQKLPSGYNRDFQLIKEPLMQAIDITKACIKIGTMTVESLILNKENMLKAHTLEIYAADEANSLVMKGTSFREAYTNIAENLDNISLQDPIKNIENKKHLGAPGNINIILTTKYLEECKKILERQAFDQKEKVRQLLN